MFTPLDPLAFWNSNKICFIASSTATKPFEHRDELMFDCRIDVSRRMHKNFFRSEEWLNTGNLHSGRRIVARLPGLDLGLAMIPPRMQQLWTSRDESKSGWEYHGTDTDAKELSWKRSISDLTVLSEVTINAVERSVQLFAYICIYFEIFTSLYIEWAINSRSFVLHNHIGFITVSTWIKLLRVGLSESGLIGLLSLRPDFWIFFSNFEYFLDMLGTSSKSEVTDGESWKIRASDDPVDRSFYSIDSTCKVLLKGTYEIKKERVSKCYGGIGTEFLRIFFREFSDFRGFPGVESHLSL